MNPPTKPVMHTVSPALCRCGSTTWFFSGAIVVITMLFALYILMSAPLEPRMGILKSSRVNHDDVRDVPVDLKPICFNRVRATGEIKPDCKPRVKETSKTPTVAPSSKGAHHASTPTCTHWCVLNRTNSYLGHMPHACQSLYPCWSWFVEQNATNRCGFVLLDGLRLKDKQASDLVDAMGCTTTTTVQDGPSFHPPPHFSGVPPGNNIKWFSSLKHADLLRERVIGTDKRPRTIGNVSVGFLQRKANRRITNFADIQRALSKLLPDAVFDFIFFETIPFKEQVHWMAKHDIIIAAHGAGLIHAAFIRPGTIVMELFPPNYYLVGLYQPLIKQSGGIALEWHAGNTPVENYHQHMSRRAMWRARDFAPNVDEVVQAIVSKRNLNR